MIHMGFCTHHRRPEWIISEFVPHKHSFCNGWGLWKTKTIHLKYTVHTHTIESLSSPCIGYLQSVTAISLTFVHLHQETW